MTAFSYLMANLKWLIFGAQADRKGRRLADNAERGQSSGPMVYYRRNFEEDYNAASAMLKGRMNARYPDSYHARLGGGGNNSYNYGDKRSQAVDTASTAIAHALRAGATAHQAAEAGAASIGI
ncbi:hypothetical protein DK389_24985 [Methylobacterium durans]|uniref:Uncharacterized protein n=2 Tax=Methylobacterium durans TaxID=2202825 RepID=A0A2U8WD04_9HYPH|nr:hypothetical protein DK389_24985 [Methylobacterium durans]